MSTVEAGSLHSISWSRDAADYEWRIEKFTEEIGRGNLRGSSISFSDSSWTPHMTTAPKNSRQTPMKFLLQRHPVDHPAAVRYWIGIKRSDGVKEVIGIGEQESGTITCPWLPWAELKRRKKKLTPSGTLTIIIKLRTGPEKEKEIKNLDEAKRDEAEREQVSNTVSRMEKSTQTDMEGVFHLSFKKRRSHEGERDIPLEPVSANEKCSQTDFQGIPVG